MRISMSVSIKYFSLHYLFGDLCRPFSAIQFLPDAIFQCFQLFGRIPCSQLEARHRRLHSISFLSYEYTNLPRTSALQEALEIIPSSRSKLLCSQSLVLISLLLIWSINIFGWILGKYAQLQIHYPAFFLNSIPSIFIDFFLPGVIAILVGALLSQKLFVKSHTA